MRGAAARRGKSVFGGLQTPSLREKGFLSFENPSKPICVRQPLLVVPDRICYNTRFDGEALSGSVRGARAIPPSRGANHAKQIPACILQRPPWPGRIILAACGGTAPPAPRLPARRRERRPLLRHGSAAAPCASWNAAAPATATRGGVQGELSYYTYALARPTPARGGDQDLQHSPTAKVNLTCCRMALWDKVRPIAAGNRRCVDGDFSRCATRSGRAVLHDRARADRPGADQTENLPSSYRPHSGK